MVVKMAVKIGRGEEIKTRETSLISNVTPLLTRCIFIIKHFWYK
jgi:hypothetical protein